MTEEKEIVTSILKKVEEKKGENSSVVSFEYFLGLLNGKEKALVKKLMAVKPREYGFKGDYLGIGDVPNNLVSVRGQKFQRDGKVGEIGIQYLPRQVYSAYKRLNLSLYRETGKKLLVESGYRSPACQMITFLRYLNFYKFDFEKTIKRVALPGYSEHGSPESQAVDFMTVEGSPSDERPLDFVKTGEYRWLLKSAKGFGFYLSYPRKNKTGIMFEPWHWRFGGIGR